MVEFSQVTVTPVTKVKVMLSVMTNFLALRWHGKFSWSFLQFCISYQTPVDMYRDVHKCRQASVSKSPQIMPANGSQKKSHMFGYPNSIKISPVNYCDGVGVLDCVSLVSFAITKLPTFMDASVFVNRLL